MLLKDPPDFPHFQDSKQHIYYSLCESLRVSRKRVLQRRVLHLGELNTTQAGGGKGSGSIARWTGSLGMAGSKTRRKLFSIWADSKSATGKLGDT